MKYIQLTEALENEKPIANNRQKVGVDILARFPEAREELEGAFCCSAGSEIENELIGGSDR